MKGQMPNELTEEVKIEEMIKKNMWGLVCDKCTGGGMNGENKCKQCGGCGIYDWRIEPLVSEIQKMIATATAEARKQERQRVIDDVESWLVEAVAGGWTTKENSRKEMDVELANAIVEKCKAKLNQMKGTQ